MVRILDLVSDWWISMLAPPGYANSTSTPSRSRASTRMSRPGMRGPTSAREGEGEAEAEYVGFAAFAVEAALLIVSVCWLGLADAGDENTQDRCQPWVFVEMSSLCSTSANGVA